MIHVKSFTFNAFGENTYIVYDSDTKDAIIFDPGCYTINEQKMLKKFIDDTELSIKKLINTHCHLDHVFGNPFITHMYGIELECHRLEIPVLARAPIAGDMYGVPTPAQPVPTLFIEDSDIVEVGNIRLRAILAPGHSPGSLCFYSESGDFLIGGDVLFFKSIGRTDLPGGNHKQLIESIQNRLFTLPETVKVYSGHGIPTTIGFEKYNNPFLI